MESKIVLVVDFNNVAYMSYHGPELLNHDGNNINAINGFFFKVKSYMDIFNPDIIVFAGDISRRTTFRRQLYPAYKATRKEVDDNLIWQFRQLKHLLSLCGYDVLDDELYEADDIIGMVSTLSKDEGYTTIIVSSDMDMYQLVDNNTNVYSQRKAQLVDIDYMMNEYYLTPEQWIDLKILQGDRSDNIPGIRGIGNKTALQLMTKYGSIESIYDNILELPRGVARRLNDGKGTLEMTRKLVTIVKDPNVINLTFHDILRKEVHIDLIHQSINELGVYGISNLIKYSFIGNNV